MLKRFEISNYMNFKDTLVFDFSNISNYDFNNECVKNGIVSKGLIYGRNATGKTNLGRAIGDISFVLSGIRISNRDFFLNADSEQEYSAFKYCFEFENNEVIYEYHKNESEEMIFEKLQINNDIVFELDYQTRNFSTINLSIINAESVQIEKYTESITRPDGTPENSFRQIPFLRFLLGNVAMASDSLLRKFENFVLKMSFVGIGTQLPMHYRNTTFLRTYMDYLAEADNLKDFEGFLNNAGIECELSIQVLPDGRKDLYFNHKLRPVSFLDTASSGTKALMSLYLNVMMSNKDLSFLYLDEFDAFYHYEMSFFIVDLYKKRLPNTQVILTTHNTSLMSNHILRPDCLFILSKQGRITPLFEATERELREGHNLEKLYIGGEFQKYE